MNHLNISDYVIPYEERRSARFRRITLSILEDRLRISAPKNVSAKQLQEFILAKQEWIIKYWLAQKALKRPKGYVDGDHIPFRGDTVELKIIKHSRKMIQVYLDGQILVVNLPQHIKDHDYSSNVRKAILLWYKAQARKVLHEKLEEQAQRMQVTFQMFRLKEQKTSWGSCSSKGNVNLNWRIIMAPDAGIDYIIIHELAHLTYLNHSELFWQRVKTFMPEYLDWQKWFKEHGRELMLNIRQ